MKYLLIVVVIAAVLWWMLRRPRVASKSEPAREPVTFVACAHCGVHLPAGDAVSAGEHRYCSDAHRLAGPRDRGAK